MKICIQMFIGILFLIDSFIIDSLSRNNSNAYHLLNKYTLCGIFPFNGIATSYIKKWITDTMGFPGGASV